MVSSIPRPHPAVTPWRGGGKRACGAGNPREAGAASWGRSGASPPPRVRPRVNPTKGKWGGVGPAGAPLGELILDSQELQRQFGGGGLQLKMENSKKKCKTHFQLQSARWQSEPC